MDGEVHIHVHFPVDALISIEGKLDTLMAQVDDLKQQVDELDGAVQDLFSRLPGDVVALEAELAKLKADDSVENTLLEGLTTHVGNIRSSIEGFAQTAPVDVPEVPPAEPSPDAPPPSA